MLRNGWVNTTTSFFFLWIDFRYFILWSTRYSSARTARPEDSESCFSPRYKRWSQHLPYFLYVLSISDLLLIITIMLTYRYCCDNFQVVIHTIRLPKQSTVGDVISDLKTKVTPTAFYDFKLNSESPLFNLLRVFLSALTVFYRPRSFTFLHFRQEINSCLWHIMEQVELSNPSAELRLLEVFYHKIYKVILSKNGVYPMVVGPFCILPDAYSFSKFSIVYSYLKSV